MDSIVAFPSSGGASFSVRSIFTNGAFKGKNAAGRLRTQEERPEPSTPPTTKGRLKSRKAFEVVDDTK